MAKIGKHSIGVVWPKQFDFKTMLRLSRHPYKVTEKKEVNSNE